jgi:hypothetical protein
MKNKKATVGETVTWLVATIIIVVILIFSVVILGAFFNNDKGIKLEGVDLLASKSFYSYLLTEDASGEIVYNQLRDVGNLNEFNGELGKEIFEEFYGEEYLSVWIGFFINRTFLPYVKNDYFGTRPTTVRGGDVYFGERFVPHIIDSIQLDENKSVELVLKVEGK